MWCKHCNDGSPMIASVDDPSLWECIECRRVFYVDSKNEGPPIPFRLNEQKRTTVFRKQETGDSNRRGMSVLDDLPEPERSFDLQHDVSSPHFRKPLGRAIRPKRTPFLFWLTLLIGVVTFTCGGSTIAWSLMGGADTIWQIGIPIAFAGQAILFVTFVLQLEWLTERTADNAQLIQRLGRKTSHGKKRARPLKTQFIRGSTVDA